MGFWLQLAILLAAIVLGARRGGMALGPMGGIGLVIFVFLFGLPPGSPPGTVLGRKRSSAAIPAGSPSSLPWSPTPWSWAQAPST